MKRPRALSEVLDQLTDVVDGDAIAISDVVKRLGERSFASLMLVFSLISASPASAIPGVTALVGAIIFILTIQMIIGRNTIWLPKFVGRKRLSTEKLSKGISWLRKPVHFVERFTKPRFTILLRRPWIFLPLILILALTLFMPFMEIVPTSGSIASAVIALFAAGLLARDGALIFLALALLSGIPLAIWHFGLAP